MKSRRVYIALNALLIASLACTIGQAAPVKQDLPATITVQALTLQAPSQTPVPPTQTSAPALTGTPTIPVVSVSAASNCRTGPYIYYDLLWTMLPGLTAEVIGKHSSSNTWVIKYPGGQCFLYGAYATVSGNTAALPEYPQPATPTPSKPAAPADFDGTAVCTPIPATLTYDVHIELTWTDLATNEEGYRIFRDGVKVATLAADSTSFEDDTTLPVAPAVFPPVPGPSVKYEIRAFNGAGTSAVKEVSFNCD